MFTKLSRKEEFEVMGLVRDDKIIEELR